MKKILLSFYLVSCLIANNVNGQQIKYQNSEEVLSLDGSWDLTGIDPDSKKDIKIEGTVPGQVHPDLMRAGIIADPFWRMQAEQCQWVENWEWRYTKTFNVPENFTNKWLMLQFDGLDTYASIYLNGKLVGKTNDMFIPFEFNISKEWLKIGKNEIEVRLAPALASVADKKKSDPIFDASGKRIYIRRMQCTFGWDWVNRLVTAGIWRSCRIVAYQDVRVDDIFAYTSSLTKEKAVEKIQVTTSSINPKAKKLTIFMTDPAGKKVWESTTALTSTTVDIEAAITKPQMWWPNGAGEHPLYNLTAVLFDDQNKELHRKIIETGIRTVTMEEIPDKDNKGSSFTIVMNGERIFAKGGNWVPADPFPSKITTEKYNRLIGQARDAGMNILRSWGGGILEPEAFWHACNTMGIMITQDFLMACASYPEDDPEFVASVQTEVAKIVKMIRNNPCLIFYAGDNELGAGSSPTGNWSLKKMHETMTGPLVRSLDPSRVFRPTSPYGGDPNNSVLAGDNHTNAQYTNELRSGDMRNYREIIDTVCNARFMSEHATAGAPPKRSLLKFMTESDLAKDEMWEYHTKDNPCAPPGHLTLYKVVESEAKFLYGDWGNDIDQRISKMEYLQYDYVRLATESSRRRMFYTSGIQFWMFNDCWPASGWSMVDYFGYRKASWYAAANANKPVIAACQKTKKFIKWWLCNDLFKSIKIDVEIKVQPTAGDPLWTKKLSITVPANSSIEAYEMELATMAKQYGKNAIIVCDIKYENGSDRSWFYDGKPGEIPFQKVNLTVSQKRTEYQGEITIHADKWARVVTLDADVDFSDNYFELLPGETKVITWKSLQPYFGEIGVSCWND